MVKRVRFEKGGRDAQKCRRFAATRSPFPLVALIFSPTFAGMIGPRSIAPLKMFIYVRWDIDINLLNDAVGWRYNVAAGITAIHICFYPYPRACTEISSNGNGWSRYDFMSHMFPQYTRTIQMAT